MTKGHTPDHGADSLGGTINLKSRSPLSMREKRRVTYNFAVRWAPPFTEHIPLREAHRSHPLFNVGYAEVFDVAGGQRNLGVVVNTFYSENAGAAHSTTRDFQNTVTGPVFLWDYQTFDQYNNRKQASLGYQWRPAVSSSIDANNLTNAPQFAYRGYSDRMQFKLFGGTTLTAGINGRF